MVIHFLLLHGALVKKDTFYMRLENVHTDYAFPAKLYAHNVHLLESSSMLTKTLRK